MDTASSNLPAAPARPLLVDDNPKRCRMVKEYLEPLGYEVALSHTGPDGLQKALCGEFQPILLDVMLPGLDDFEVLKRIRERPQCPLSYSPVTCTSEPGSLRPISRRCRRAFSSWSPFLG